MRMIADKIEYKVGTIYHYYKDEIEIFFGLHNSGFAEFYNKQLSVQHIKDQIERLFAHGEVMSSSLLNILRTMMLCLSREHQQNI